MQCILTVIIYICTVYNITLNQQLTIWWCDTVINSKCFLYIKQTNPKTKEYFVHTYHHCLCSFISFPELSFVRNTLGYKCHCTNLMKIKS